MNRIKTILRHFLFFIVLLSPMIVFHEFGHYALGKILDLNPHTFSLGFGQSIASVNFLDTTWKVGWIPLGGYVEFPDSAKDNSIAWAAVCYVGPLFNFIFALGIFLSLGFLRSLSLLKFEGTFRGKEGKFLIFKPSKLFTGPTRSVFIPNQGRIRLVKSEGLHLSKPLPLSNSIKEYLKLILQLSFVRYRSLDQRAVLRYGIQGKKPAKFKASGFLGPLGLASLGSWAYKISPAYFLLVCADVSISLGVFNLIPLSFLDGGQGLMALLNIKLTSETLTDGQGIYVIVSAFLVLLVLLLSVGGDIFRLLKNLFKKERKL